MKNPCETRFAVLIHCVAGDGDEKHRLTWYYTVSSEMKGYSQDEGGHRTAVFLTSGTAEEGHDFVSVLQPVPHTGKHFQRDYRTATWEEDEGMDGNGERGAERERGRQGKEVGVKKYINK